MKEIYSAGRKPSSWARFAAWLDFHSQVFCAEYAATVHFSFGGKVCAKQSTGFFLVKGTTHAADGISLLRESGSAVVG
jgi:hypothetical protein